MTDSFVRRLTVADVADFRAIRLLALRTSPESFGSVYEIEAARPMEAFGERLQSSIVFGAYDGSRIIGVVGLRQEDGPRDAHKGFMWGFFVEPDHRGRGVGRLLVTSLLEAAREIVEQITLSVVDGNLPALALYRRLGFVQYGLEPRALKDSSGYANEVLMVRFLVD